MPLVSQEPYGVVTCDPGSKSSELYGKLTWKIDNFLDIKARELRSHVFEIGSCKWYLLMYPQGIDRDDYLSLFLCVANQDELLPRWSHLAMFTISIMNRYPYKSKSSDSLHRFWKKEHNWGWKKYIGLSKLQEGFTHDSDSLIINVQVQVINESMDRPFHCLDKEYKMELLKVYSKNVEKIFVLFMEEKNIKFSKLIEDEKRWKSLCAFWLGMEKSSRLELSKEKMDVILTLVVKHFFNNKEVTSTLVMDFLFYGLRSLDGTNYMMHRIANIVAKVLLEGDSYPLNKESLGNKRKTHQEETNKKVGTIVRVVDKDMFVLADDMISLLKRFVVWTPPRKEFQNLKMVMKLDERYNLKEDEERLNEFGMLALEIFALDYIFFNKIEVAYQEAIALKIQEELIREEEEQKKNKVK